MNYLAVAGDYALWWYSGGLIRLVRWISALFGWLSNYFSIGRVFKTLFSPWKRLVSERRPGLDGLRDWLLDNFISRLVGFMMRFFIILIYLISMVALAIFAGVVLVFWVTLPILAVLSILKMLGAL